VNKVPQCVHKDCEIFGLVQNAKRKLLKAQRKHICAVEGVANGKWDFSGLTMAKPNYNVDFLANFDGHKDEMHLSSL